ncbi:Inner membrane protein YbaL [Candidatus Nitrosocosmicus oleophilus]|uniref:Inner membrane protein YbaL n=1 Tax=Candidatus Nitrosocosmicus oleophilus TaxID=1353260 RepID=A0A654M0J9_9ARCH|nr:cation:proton antiporter [Candidatus Nitrosocosmicus oleophilus]ALI36061.1 Inner membrane protein YbaL [Candidatus Nitrosocosmicus oleophilus]
MAIEITQILQDFATIMIIAAVMTIISYKLKQPLILGYIGAGIIIGPHTPPFSFISNVEVLNLFAEIGIILLLFTVGMEFPIRNLRKIGKRATIITLAEQTGTMIAGFFVGQALNMSFYDSLFMAVALSVSSTVVIMKVLEELKILREEASYLTLGILIIEDIIILSIFALLHSTTVTGNISIVEILIPIGITIAFIAGVLIIGSRTIPRLVDFVARTNQSDVLVVAVLGLAFGFAYVSNLLGISVAVGAFFAGVLIAESKSHAVTSILTTPIRDMFVALFFVSVGALMDINLIPVFIIPALILVGVTSVVKFAIVFLTSRYQGFSKITAIQTGIDLSASRGGEMSLIVAKGGIDIGVVSSFILPIIGTITLISTFLAPYLIKLGLKLADRNNNVNSESKSPNESKSAEPD